MLKNLILVIAFFVFAFACFGQDITTAEKAYKAGNYSEALEDYNKLFINDSLNKELNYKMGVCHFYLKNYDKAEAHFLKSSSAVSLELFRYKAAIAHAKMKFKKATNFYNAYKLIAGKKEMTNDQITQQVEKVKFAEISITNKRDVLVTNFNEINTSKAEGGSYVIADESKLLYNSGEELFSIEKKNNSFTTPEKISDDKIVGMSTDGQTMYIERDGDIYEAHMGLDKWEEPVKMGSNINSEYNESGVTITLDDKVMYFVSDRPGGFGGKDIYKVMRLPNGAWSRALNMGPIINSSEDEETPFIHSDKKTLYFSSKGHQNMGGYDVFKTVFENGIWNEPENLKYPINTVDDELSYTIVGSGKVAYYTSYSDKGKGGTDIFKVVLKDEFAQFHVLKAMVEDNVGKPIPAKITLIENETKKVQGIYKSNATTGKFIMLIDPDKTYNFIIEAQEYKSFTSDLKYDVNSTDLIEYKLDKK